MADREDHSCFWMGGLVAHVTSVMLGMLIVSGIARVTVLDVLKTERALGACEAACFARGYEQSTVLLNERLLCVCTSSTAPSAVVDPRRALDPAAL